MELNFPKCWRKVKNLEKVERMLDRLASWHFLDLQQASIRLQSISWEKPYPPNGSKNSNCTFCCLLAYIERRSVRICVLSKWWLEAYPIWKRTLRYFLTHALNGSLIVVAARSNFAWPKDTIGTESSSRPKHISLVFAPLFHLFYLSLFVACDIYASLLFLLAEAFSLLFVRSYALSSSSPFGPAIILIRLVLLGCFGAVLMLCMPCTHIDIAAHVRAYKVWCSLACMPLALCAWKARTRVCIHARACVCVCARLCGVFSVALDIYARSRWTV